MSEVLLKHSRVPRKYDPKDVKAPERSVLNAANLPKLREANPMVILQRYLSDESTSVIASDYGVTRQALGQFLLKHAEEEWKEAQVARAIARKEKAEDDLETAADPLALAKARELLKAAQWDLERVCRRIYGEERAQVNVIAPILNITVNGEEQKQPALAQVSLAHARPSQVIDVEVSPAMHQSGKSLTDQ
jgi:hypothetical protein